jgi:hypothetical protein
VVKFGGHLLHVELIVLENIPLGHGTHTGATMKNPGGHLHEPMPMLFGGDTVPDGHGRHDEKS